MSRQSEPRSGSTGGGPEKVWGSFQEAWNSSQDHFDQWVKDVSLAFRQAQRSRTPIRLLSAAALVGATPAEIAAVLRLAALDDEALILLSKKVPPKTTWLDLAEGGEGVVKDALSALAKDDGRRSPQRIVEELLKQRTGPSALERVSALPAEVIGAMQQRAEAYRMFKEENRKFMKSMSSMQRKGQYISPARWAYLESLLRQMKEAGVLNARSGEEDARACRRALDALGDEE